MSGLYIGQNYSGHINSSNGGLPAGGSNVPGDGINWPFSSGNNPNIGFNPNESVNQIEDNYRRLIQYLKDNPGCYNGYIRLLEMTIDMGKDIGKFPELKAFLSKELTDGTTNIFALIVQAVCEGAAVSQPDAKSGLAAAQALINQLMSATSGLQGIPLFQTIYNTAKDESSTIGSWINSHSSVINGKFTWLTDASKKDGKQEAITFDEFAGMAAFSIGVALIGDHSNTDEVVNSFYESQIEQLVHECKDNPWMLLVALMNLINQRNDDRGMAINGYGGNLSTLKDANSLVESLLGSISGSTPKADIFFDALQKLRTLVEQDPALSSLTSQLQSDIDTICGQDASEQERVTPPFGQGGFIFGVGPGRYHFPPGTLVMDANTGKEIPVPADGWITFKSGETLKVCSTAKDGSFTVGELKAMGDTKDATQPDPYSIRYYEWTAKKGFYNFPPGAKVTIDGKPIIVPKNGVVYVPNDNADIKMSPPTDKPLTFGQLAAMGDTADIGKAMGAWSTTVMSNFENGVTGIQTLLNGASPAIQQQIQTATQTMQAEQNFEKQAFSSITTMNQQIMRMIQQVMG